MSSLQRHLIDHVDRRVVHRPQLVQVDVRLLASLGWERVMRHNHALATWAHQRLVERWGVEPISPVDGSLLGSMATMRLPEKLAKMNEDEMTVVQQRLYGEHGVEAPLFPFAGEVMLRVACQVYNRPEHIERLGEAVLWLASSQ